MYTYENQRPTLAIFPSKPKTIGRCWTATPIRVESRMQLTRQQLLDLRLAMPRCGAAFLGLGQDCIILDVREESDTYRAPATSYAPAFEFKSKYWVYLIEDRNDSSD